MILIFFILGVLAGIAATVIRFSCKIDGTLRIDHSDPDGPFMFLEVERSAADISYKHFVVLRVDFKNYISRE